MINMPNKLALQTTSSKESFSPLPPKHITSSDLLFHYHYVINTSSYKLSNNIILSDNTYRRLKAPSRCLECNSYVYFNGAECEKVC